MFHQPYRMIVVSFTASIILLAGLLIYRFVFPKKIITLFVLLLLVSLLPIISIARQGTYESGVLSENIQITRSFYDNLTEGNIIPVWGADYFGGYGDPQHAYIYPLAYYFSSFFHFLGFSYLDSVKLVLAFTFVFSGITMFLWMKDEFGEIPGFVAALFYTFAPYHLIETHFRATLGVTTAFAFIPLVFFFIHKTLMQPKVLSVFLGGVSFGLLILSQLAVALLCFPLFFFYALYLYMLDTRRLRGLLSCYLLLIFGALLTAYYTIPAIFYSNSSNLIAHLQTSGFIPLKNLLYAPTMFGFLFQGHNGETHFIIGYAQLLMVFIALILVFIKKINSRKRRLLLCILSSFFLYALLTQPFTKPAWRLPLLKNVADAWKLLAPIALITSAVASIVANIMLKSDWPAGYISRFMKGKNNAFQKTVLEHVNTLIIAGICLFAVFSTILNWGNRRTVPVDYEQIKQAWTSITPGIASVIATPWVDLNAAWTRQPPRVPIAITDGKAEVSQISRQITRHEYILRAETSVKLTENTMYFPGWIVKVNNKVYPFSFQSYPNAGLITFQVKKGLYKVEVRLTKTFVQKLGIWISLLSFAFVLFLLILKTRQTVGKTINSPLLTHKIAISL